MLAGSAVIILPLKFTPGVQTQFGLKDLLDVSVVALNGPYAGQEWMGEQFMSAKLTGQLKSLVGQMTLGRIALDPTARPGSMGPMVLANPEAGDEQAAKEWLAEHPGRIAYLKSEGLRIAEAKAAERAAQAPPQAAGYGYPPGYGQQGAPQFQPAAAGGFPAPPAPISPPPF
jgi:hypothetical protein